MNRLWGRHSGPGGRFSLLLLLGISSIGCAAIQFAQLENVVKESRLAAGTEIQDVQVTRAGATVTTAPGMGLEKGDRIVTGGATQAVLLFGDTYEVILGPDTEISILNPSIFMKFGRALVKKLREIREEFRVETTEVSAGVKRTEFAIAVDRQNVVSLVVREGSVVVESKARRWEPVIYQQHYGGTIRGSEQPVVRIGVPEREVERAFEWARGAVAITRPVAVPDVTGIPLDQANQRLSQAGLPAGRVENVPAEGRPLRTVLGQSPRAGERVRLGTKVSLRVAAEATVPDVRGMTALEAGIVLGIASLKVGETSEAEDSEARPGRVVRQSPAAGTKVPPGSAVALVTASRSSQCTVPDIRQVSVEDAPRVLEAAGLKLGNVTRREGGHSQQTPEPGARVACGSSVDLVIGGGLR